MKQTFIILMTLLAVTTARADGYPYLIVETSDGTTQSLTVDQLVLTFSNGQLVATNSDDSQRFTLTDLNKMYFSTNGQTAIERIELGDLEADGAEVFDLQGRKVSDMTRKGIYLIRQNNKTRKVLVK